MVSFKSNWVINQGMIQGVVSLCLLSVRFNKDIVPSCTLLSKKKKKVPYLYPAHSAQTELFSQFTAANRTVPTSY